MKLTSALLQLLALPSLVVAPGPVPVQRSGLAGIAGFTFYDPYCGHACYRSFSPFTLSCSKNIEAGGHTTADQLAHDIAVCRATNFPFLSSIAWCIHLYCPASVQASLIEKFWETEITGDISVVPRWSYGETMARIQEPPMDVLAGGQGQLNKTSLTTVAVFNVTENTLMYSFRETALESKYGIALCVALFAVPILMTWLGYVPFLSRVIERAKPYLYQSVVGSYHERPLPFSLGNAPTIGQALFIALMVILNIVFISVNYKTLYPQLPMQWYANHYQELMYYVCLRTGVMAFCLMPVLILFSSRNNVLLWLTNWSHGTFMLLHRWVARIFLIQALLHSILALVLWVKTGEYDATGSQPFWVWGCVAIVAAVIIVLTSFLVLRRRSYELFLITHIVLAVILMVGCWYHIQFEYEFTFGYETWLYAAVAVWFFDRLVRLLRLVHSGLRYARVTEIGSGIVRVDVPGIRWASLPGNRVHVYFPTLKPLRPWENHPFSMIPTALLERADHSSQSGSVADDKALDASYASVPKTMESTSAETARKPHGQPLTSAGLTMFIRKSGGMTSFLKEDVRLLTLVEGPYPNNATRAVIQSDRLLLIGGGIGITGLLSFLLCHQNLKLFYSIKSEDRCLLTTLDGVLDGMREKEILIGQRLAISNLLRKEAEIGWRKIAVVVCGPAGMCDDVRMAVAEIAKEKSGVCTFELEIDAFSW